MNHTILIYIEVYVCIVHNRVSYTLFCCLNKAKFSLSNFPHIFVNMLFTGLSPTLTINFLFPMLCGDDASVDVKKKYLYLIVTMNYIMKEILYRNVCSIEFGENLIR